MYEIDDIQDYKMKWLEAERDLALNWAERPSSPLDYEPIENIAHETPVFLDLVKRGLSDAAEGRVSRINLDKI